MQAMLFNSYIDNYRSDTLSTEVSKRCCCYRDSYQSDALSMKSASDEVVTGTVIIEIHCQGSQQAMLCYRSNHQSDTLSRRSASDECLSLIAC